MGREEVQHFGGQTARNSHTAYTLFIFESNHD
jgi:hypothetical protein